MSFQSWLEWREIAGEFYGTYDTSLLLHVLVSMQKPKRILELGTGFGVSTLALGLACQQYGGSVRSIDDGRDWPMTYASLLEGKELILSRVQSPAFRKAMELTLNSTELPDYHEWLRAMAAAMNLDKVIHFDKSSLKLSGTQMFEEEVIPSTSRYDFVFVDCGHHPHYPLTMLAQCLVRCSSNASIFFDTWSTFYPTYAAMKSIVDGLNRGKLTPGLLEVGGRTLQSKVLTHDFQLVPLVTVGNRPENGLLWLRIAPEGPFPSPPTDTDGFFARRLGKLELEDLVMKGEFAEEPFSSVLLREQLARKLRTLPDEKIGELFKQIEGE